MSWSLGSDSNEDRQDISECPDGDDHDEEDKESPGGANKQKEKIVNDTVFPAKHSLARESLPPTIVEDMEEMSLRLGFSQTATMKLVDNKEIDSPWTLAIQCDEDIVTFCDVIRRPGGLVSGKTPDRGNQISILVAKNLKLTIRAS